MIEARHAAEHDKAPTDFEFERVHATCDASGMCGVHGA